MKKLQNNFTTPEQSKRLLELGVSADSADCYYSRMQHDEFENPRICYMSYSNHAAFHPKIFIYLPCWSVGRLIEIYLTCALEYHPYDDFYTETPSLHLMSFDKDRLIEELIKIMSDDEMDFSKLEE